MRLLSKAPVRRGVRGGPLEAATPLLDAREIFVTYQSGGRAIEALRGVSLSVASGELVGLIGPNGSGKSTLVRVVTGVVAPAGGNLQLLGIAARILSQRERALRVAVVPQNPALPDAFTALEVVLMGRNPRLRLLENEGRRDMEAVTQAMRATETVGLADRRIGELSGGERQRVVVARALAQETPLLLLDEPTAHLDIGHQASVLELMRRLCREDRRGVLAVVHDLTLAAQFSDRLVMLCDGEIAAQGTADQVLQGPVIQRVYGAAVQVLAHPQTGRPVVAPSAPGA